MGDFQAAQDKATLDKKGIKTVLTVASYLNIKYNDPNMNHKVFSQFIRYIKYLIQNKQILLHCLMTHSI